MAVPIRNIVFECPDERALASFYAALLGMGGSCPVFADPAGHPFCLCAPDQ